MFVVERKTLEVINTEAENLKRQVEFASEFFL